MVFIQVAQHKSELARLVDILKSEIEYLDDGCSNSLDQQIDNRIMYSLERIVQDLTEIM
jgi:hypothetical protein